MVATPTNLVRSLSERRLLKVPYSSWSEPVTFAEAEENDQEQIALDSAYVLPLGTEISAETDPKDIPGARKMTSALLYRLQYPESAATVMSYDAGWKQTARYEAICNIDDESLTFHIDGIGKLVITRQEKAQRSASCDSILFTPTESYSSEACNFLSSITLPNVLGLEYTCRNKPIIAFLRITEKHCGDIKGEFN